MLWLAATVTAARMAQLAKDTTRAYRSNQIPDHSDIMTLSGSAKSQAFWLNTIDFVTLGGSDSIE
jgi:hypothetical protein